MRRRSCVRRRNAESDEGMVTRCTWLFRLFCFLGLWAIESPGRTEDKLHLALEIHRSKSLIHRLVADNLIALDALAGLGEWQEMVDARISNIKQLPTETALASLQIEHPFEFCEARCLWFILLRLSELGRGICRSASSLCL